MRLRVVFGTAVSLVLACGGTPRDDVGAAGSTGGPLASDGGSSGSSPLGRGGAGANGPSSGGHTPAAGAGSSGGGATNSSGSSSGGLAAPKSTFTLPVPMPAAGKSPALYYPKLTESFPDVDWETLDRLYIPAGKYQSIQLGGLPRRQPERPLVITNWGGQVVVGGEAANYVFVINGGSNWILTGRYDAAAKTGDAAFPGHAEGAYAHSQGTYGILSDDGFSKEGLSGLAIGGKASDFEIEMIEVAHAEFAGIVAKTDNDGSATMRNVKLHDVYIHDTGSEGIYFGSTQAQPQHAFENLHVYRNRMLRTGTEALQTGQLGSDCEIDHNVLGPAAVRWRSAFQKYQDGNVQLGQRYGSSRFHHNVVIGTGDLFVEFFPTPVEGDPRAAEDSVTFSDNYFADSSLSGVYTHAEATGVHVVFERNAFLGFEFNYSEVYPDTEAPLQVFGVGSNTTNPHLLRDNEVDAPFPFIKWTFPSVTLEGNSAAPLPRVEFRDFMTAKLDENYRQLEWWTATATLSPDQRAVVYPEGAFVMHRGKLYRALQENQGQPPDAHPETWAPEPDPADDVRLAPSSAYAGLGLE